MGKENRITQFIDLKKAQLETREEGGVKQLVGFIPYGKKSHNLGGFIEIINPTAFRKSLADGYDVKALVSHDSGMILGRVKNSTLSLEDSADGLRAVVTLGNTSYAQDLWENVKRGDAPGLSFGFQTVEDKWMQTEEETVRELVSVRLLEVSFGVVWPAYEDTTASVRSREDYIERMRELLKENTTRAAEEAPGGKTQEEPQKNEELRSGPSLQDLEKELEMLQKSI